MEKYIRIVAIALLTSVAAFVKLFFVAICNVKVF